MIIAVDPGLHPGWVVFAANLYGERSLVAAGDRVETFDRLPLISIVLGLVEVPQHYAGGRERNPGAILTLAVDAGRWIERLSRFGPVEPVWPRTWKGTAPKAVMQRRVLAALTATERAVLEGLRGDAIDAAGLGLWKLGRLNSRT